MTNSEKKMPQSRRWHRLVVLAPSCLVVALLCVAANEAVQGDLRIFDAAGMEKIKLGADGNVEIRGDLRVDGTYDGGLAKEVARLRTEMQAQQEKIAQLAARVVVAENTKLKHRSFNFGIRTGSAIQDEQAWRIRVPPGGAGINVEVARIPEAKKIHAAFVEWTHHTMELVKYTGAVPTVEGNIVKLHLNTNSNEISISTITVHVLYE